MATLITPTLFSKSRITLYPPWAVKVNQSMQYTCVAIRAFDDIYKLGVDVYKKYYVPMGVTNGATINNEVFSFDTEKAKQPSIITFISDSGDVIYVPNTFIASYGDSSDISYSHIILSVSLGAVADTIDLSALKTDIASFVQSKFGVNPDVLEHRAPSSSTPTADEHAAIESARKAAITNGGSTIGKLKHQASIISSQASKLTSLTTAVMHSGVLTTVRGN